MGAEDILFTFSKLGPFMIFGIIQKGPDKWINTKVHVKHGILKPGSFTLPRRLLDVIRMKAVDMSSAMNSMSERQQNKIQDEIVRNPEKFASSEQFKAFIADAELFGLNAILKK